MKKIIETIVIAVLFIALIFIGRQKLAAFYFNKGSGYYDQQRYKEAIKYFNKSIYLNPLIDTVHYSLGNTYLQEKLEDKAIEEYKEAIRINSRFIWGYEALADIYTRKGLYQKTIDMLTQAQLIAQDNKEISDLIRYTSSIYLSALLNSSIDAFLNHNKEKAYELLKIALKVNPDFAYTYYVFGYFYYTEQKYDQAINMLEQAVKIDSQFYLTHKLLGDIYFKKNMFYQAINEYKKVLSVDKNNATALSNLGLAYMNLEKYSEAVYFLVQAVQINPNKANFRYSLASVYRDRRMFNEAVSEYQKVIDLDSGYPNVHNDLGDIYIAEGKSEEARKEYQEEVSLCQQKLLGNPRDPFTLKDLSYAFSKLKDYQNALNNIKKAIAIKPDYQEAHLLLALIQRELKEYDNAMNSLEKARSFSRQKQLFIDNEIGRVKKDLETYYQSRAKYEPLDEVYLKNGGMFRGTIQKEDNNRIILEISIGKSTGTVILYRDDIKQIVKAEKN